MSSVSIINEAGSWLGTRFKHQGRIKKNKDDNGGCDCLGLIMGLGIKTKNGEFLKKYDQSNYPKTIQSNELLIKLDGLLEKVSLKDLREGDVILIMFNEWPQHLALIKEIKEMNIVIIHSYIQARKVVEQYLPKDWYDNIVAVYRSK